METRLIRKDATRFEARTEGRYHVRAINHGDLLWLNADDVAASTNRPVPACETKELAYDGVQSPYITLYTLHKICAGRQYDDFVKWVCTEIVPEMYYKEPTEAELAQACKELAVKLATGPIARLLLVGQAGQTPQQTERTMERPVATAYEMLGKNNSLCLKLIGQGITEKRDGFFRLTEKGREYGYNGKNQKNKPCIWWYKDKWEEIMRIANPPKATPLDDLKQNGSFRPAKTATELSGKHGGLGLNTYLERAGIVRRALQGTKLVYFLTERGKQYGYAPDASGRIMWYVDTFPKVRAIADRYKFGRRA